MKYFRSFFVLAGAAALCGLPASASAVYSQNFDTGSATYTSDPYWGPTANSNGYICTSTSQTVPSTCDGGNFLGEITADQSGSGSFLFEGSGGSYPSPAQTIFFESPSFAVTTFTNYSITFFLTNANTLVGTQGSGQQYASVQADINGLLGSPVTATGFYSDAISGDQWQQFTFNWSSGNHTTAQLILHDLTQTTIGNDFGIDAIAVNSTGATVPEPGTFALFGAGALAGLAWFRRKAARRSSV